MCKINPKNDSRRIDPCMKNLIGNLKLQGLKTLACCCGHGKYPMTVIVWDDIFDVPRELFSNKALNRKRKFYKKDSAGYYYVPEALGRSKSA